MHNFSRFLRKINIAQVAILPILFLVSFVSNAATYYVQNALDNGDPTSLRVLVAGAVNGDVILFDASLDGISIVLNSALTIEKDITISGNGIDHTIIERGSGANFSLLKISSNVKIDNVSFTNGGGSSLAGLTVKGGAIYNDNVTGLLTLVHCAFKNNKAESGGAVYIESGEAKVFNCIFEKNESLTDGGAIVFQSSTPQSHLIDNCLFDGNSSDYGGAVNQNTNSVLNVFNCTFVNNTAGSNGGAIYRATSLDIKIANSIFYSNSAAIADDVFASSVALGSHNLLESYSGSGMSAGVNGNITGNPHFRSASLSDYRLQFVSPCLNTGSNSYATNSLDLAKQARIKGTTVDMGAYENTRKAYVKQSALGLNIGTSWENAFKDLQDALAVSAAIDTIWIAQGVYLPTSGSDRSISFEIPNNMKLFGGFEGNEPSDFDLSLRSIDEHVTTLSGNINDLTLSDDNSYHVVSTTHVSSNTLVNGVTIAHGNQTDRVPLFVNSIGAGWFNDGSGAGNSSNPTIKNVVFFANYAIDGGALYNNGSNGGEASPLLTNVVFKNNSANGSGGAMGNNGSNGTSSPILNQVSFISNTSNTAGAMRNGARDGGYSSPIITNCFFKGNSTSAPSSGVFYNDAFNGGTVELILTNCTFAYNSSIMFNFFTSLNPGTSNSTIKNCIFWDNPGNGSSNVAINSGPGSMNIAHSLVEASNCGNLGPNVTCSNMIFNQNPQFVDAANGNLNIKCNSPAINEGTATGAPVVDITGFTRIGNPDIGAYEYGAGSLSVETLIADSEDPNLYGVPFLNASSLIANTNNAVYTGEKYVELLPGFQVAPATGAETVFRAEVNNPCP